MRPSGSVKQNFVYHSIETISATLFPLIAFPYASRILLPDGIGQVQFFKSIINYVVMLSSLGIPMYGIREIAKVRDDMSAMARTTAELLTLNLILAMIGYAIIAFLCCCVGKVQENIPLFLIMSSTILLTAIGCPWFFQGVEDFRFLTLRSLLVRLVALVFLFLFVKTKEDLLVYGIYSVIGAVGNNVLNFIELQRRGVLRSAKVHELHPWRHFHGILLVFAFEAAMIVYVNLDPVMLGFMGEVDSVGYFTAAIKVIFILVTLVTTLSAVLMPRASHLVSQGEMEEFSRLSKKSYDLLLWAGIPLSVGIAVMGSTVIDLFCGGEYAPAVLTLQILAPIVLVKSVSNMLGRQVLYPEGHIRLVTLCTSMGIVLNVVLNLLLIPKYGQNGASAATVFAECLILFLMLILARKLFGFKMMDRRIFWYLLSGVLLGVFCILLMRLIPGLWNRAIVIPVLGAAFYVGLQLVTKDELTLDILQSLKKGLLARG